MSRIADKHGLTNKYRQSGMGKRVVRRGRPRKYLLGAPKRSWKKTYNSRNVNNNLDLQTPTTNDAIGCVGCGTVILVIFVIFCIIIGTSNSSNDEPIENNPPVETLETSTNVEEIDTTAYTGDSGVSGQIKLEKEFDSNILETTTYIKNNSGKNISKITLYLVKCYDGESPIDSWKYTNRLNIENIPAGSSKTTEWTLGTTTYGKKEFKTYVGYVLYEDGTQWGKEEIDHKAVVTRNAEVEVSFNEVEKFSWKQ